MNKLLELLFLKNLKGIGNSTINKNYIKQLTEVEGLDDCSDLVKQININ